MKANPTGENTPNPRPKAPKKKSCSRLVPAGATPHSLGDPASARHGISTSAAANKAPCTRTADYGPVSVIPAMTRFETRRLNPAKTASRTVLNALGGSLARQSVLREHRNIDLALLA